MKRQFYIHPGRLLKIDQAEFQARLISSLGEISTVANVQFIRSIKPRGIQFQTVDAPTMYRLSRRKDGKVYLGFSIGQRVYFLNDRDRFGIPEQRIVELVTIHEVLHVFGFEHSTDRTSIMHADGIANRMNSSDVLKLQRKFGRPK